MKPAVSTSLWFDKEALPAAEFYCSLLPDSEIVSVQYRSEPDDVLAVEFTLGGVPYMIINGGPMFPLSEAVSILVKTADQAETDRLWTALTADGGQESRCGWLKDRYGLSWQIVPRRALELMTGPRSAAVWPVLLEMGKIDVARLEAAAGD